jgi:hypothetical protein
MNATTPLRLTVLSCASLLAGAAPAQTAHIKPPQAQAWIDVATFSGMGMPMGAMGGAGGMGGNPMSALGGMFGGAGGGSAKNSFGQTQAGAAGRWVDATLYSRNNPALAEAQQAVPAGFMSPALKLQAPRDARPAPEDDDKVVEPDHERPKGKLLLYWGCGATVRAGQPKVLDMASASAADLAAFFVSRRATQRGAHGATGRPLWPNAVDARMVPDGASLVGEHVFSGTGVPEGFRFQIAAAQDLMPPLQVQQADQGGALALQWNALPTARAYFVAGMGAARQDEMVIWSSSELPDTGFGLLDYQTNTAVDRWLREKVLLPTATTQCTVPKGVFPGEGAMLRVIAYGNELNLAHPPRPADPKAAWAPLWAVKLRVKSVAMLMPGMPAMGNMPPAERGSDKPGQPAEKDEPSLKPMDLLKGILGR